MVLPSNMPQIRHIAGGSDTLDFSAAKYDRHMLQMESQHLHWFKATYVCRADRASWTRSLRKQVVLYGNFSACHSMQICYQEVDLVCKTLYAECIFRSSGYRIASLSREHRLDIFES